jgi:hypothetical protein
MPSWTLPVVGDHGLIVVVAYCCYHTLYRLVIPYNTLFKLLVIMDGLYPEEPARP